MLEPAIALRNFEHEVRRRTRAILGLREHPDPIGVRLCISALDHACTRGVFNEQTLVDTARQIADDTQRWR